MSTEDDARRRAKLVRAAQVRQPGLTPARARQSRAVSDRTPTDPALGHADTTWPWDVLQISAEILGAAELVRAGLGRRPAATVYGSARTKPGDREYEIAEEIGFGLAQKGYAVITGGGPGIMEAANKGCQRGGGFSVGFGIELPFEQGMNRFLDFGHEFRFFLTRKHFLRARSQVLLVLPGGLGTMDEALEAICLKQTGKMGPKEIVLVGHEYWGGLTRWLGDTVARSGKISPRDMNLFHVCDTPAEVMAVTPPPARRVGPREPSSGPRPPVRTPPRVQRGKAARVKKMNTRDGRTT